MPFLVFRISRQRLPIAACGLLCLLLAAAACSDRRSSVAQTPAGTTLPRTQFPMPPTTTTTTAPRTTEGGPRSGGFTLLDNRRMSLSDYAGEVVVLDFYATWCAPCREEAPHLVSLHERFGAQGLRIIGLNVGGEEDRERVPEFISRFRIPYTLGFPDPEMRSLYLSDDDRIPQAFVFDRKGNLVKRFIAYDSAMPAELERVIRAELARGD